MPSLNVVVSGSTVGEANNAVRVTRAAPATFNGATALPIDRRNAATNNKSETIYLDPNVGYLRILGEENFDSTGTLLVQTRTRTGRPDLRGTAVGATANYTETFTKTGGSPVPSNDTFTFLGYEKITTPAGTFDTCKVKFSYASDGSTETYWHAPNLHWVRLDTTLGSVRTTRELISHAP